MDNQTCIFNTKNIRSIAIHSNCSVKLDQVNICDYDIVFTSPEVALSNQFRTILTYDVRRSISLITIDEAHCITQWGKSEFRPEYANITQLLAIMPHVPVLVLTATMTEDMKIATMTTLNLGTYITVALSPDRPEIFIDVQRPIDGCLDWLCNDLIAKKQ